MSALGYRLLPKTAAGNLTQEYQIDRYLSELAIPQGSPLVGKTLEQAALSEIGLVVLTIVREGDNFFPQPFHQLCEGDVLIVQASRKDLLQAHDSPSLHIRTSGQLDDLDLVNRASTIVESILMPQSTLIGRTLKELTFRQRFGVSALALYRRGHALVTAVADLPLRVGDVLLLQGQQEQFESLRGNRDLWVLAEMQRLPFRKRRGTYALIALLVAVTMGGSQVLPLSVAFLLAALSVIALKCVTIEEAYSLIEWRLIILIGGMTSFGMAMQKTHAAEYLAHLIVDWTLPLGLYFVLAALVILTMLLTQPMSNAAAALVVLPVALSTASQLQVDPRSVAVLITLSASLSFVAPFEPACMLVYGPGKYRFRDFIKSGLPLSVMVFIILMLLVPILWPLE